MLRSIDSFLGSFGILLCLASLSVAGTADTRAMSVGWELERDVEVPSYAVTEPASTNLNIDSVCVVVRAGPKPTRPATQAVSLGRRAARPAWCERGSQG